jgi:hypothetical protein
MEEEPMDEETQRAMAPKKLRSCGLVGKLVSLMLSSSLLLRRGKPSSNRARESKINFEHVISFWS